MHKLSNLTVVNEQNYCDYRLEYLARTGSLRKKNYGLF